MFSDSTINRTETIITGEVLMDNEAIQVYGSKWCGDCFRAKMILDNHHTNHVVIDIEQDENARHS
jgi:NifU-like protein involved in Fe-S cluster formation